MNNLKHSRIFFSGEIITIGISSFALGFATAYFFGPN